MHLLGFPRDEENCNNVQDHYLTQILTSKTRFPLNESLPSLISPCRMFTRSAAHSHNFKPPVNNMFFWNWMNPDHKNKSQKSPALEEYLHIFLEQDQCFLHQVSQLNWPDPTAVSNYHTIMLIFSRNMGTNENCEVCRWQGTLVETVEENYSCTLDPVLVGIKHVSQLLIAWYVCKIL